MSSKISFLKGGLFGLLLIFFVFLILINSFSHVRNSISDKVYGKSAVLDNIIIVAIDDESINKIGRWPWDREVLAKLLEKTRQAKGIGVDVSFFEVSGNDSMLEKIIGQQKNVVLAAEVNKEVVYKPIFNAEYGYVNLYTDSDGVTRNVQYGLDKEVKPFSFVIYEKVFGKVKEGKEGLYKINFPNKKFTTLKAVEVLDKDYDFTNKIVLIGATAPDLHDTYFVPTSEGEALSGVEIQATILQNLMLDDFVKTQSRISVILLVMLFSVIGMFWLAKLRTPQVILILIVLMMIYGGLGIVLFDNFNYLIDFLFVPLSVFIFTGTGMGVNYFEERKLNVYLTDAFGRYISKDLLGEIIAHKQELKLGGAKREVTIFFSDIRGFTTISEKMKPEELVPLLNEYLTEMTQVILENRGTVDKFIGDAIMAFWNAPLPEKRHAYLACKASVEQIEHLKRLQKKWKERGLPVINAGMGVHTGEAVIGNMGSEDRFDYTAIGDTINLGSRLEGLTKQYGVDIIVSDEVYRLVKNEFRLRKLDLVKVKGKNVPIAIYELCIDENKKFKDEYEKGLEMYFKRKFKEAEKMFKKAKQGKKDDLSCELMISRCKEYAKHPPEKNWDGAYVMKSK